MKFTSGHPSETEPSRRVRFVRLPTPPRSSLVAAALIVAAAGGYTVYSMALGPVGKVMIFVIALVGMLLAVQWLGNSDNDNNANLTF
ncbi:MAG: hypothetical protein SFZ24_09540 [Planctomycetota bacterium]|nr:hypothetical protein [Planctomycetota bacterium]